ncbi:gamma-glutamyl kinase [Paracoccaceae bacterium GXU_MW_L88]
MTKAGSSAVEAAFAPHCEVILSKAPNIKHMRYRRYEKVVLPFLERLTDGPFESFAILRDPIDWLESWHRYRARPELNGHPNSTSDMTFETFAERYLSRNDETLRPIGRPKEFLKSTTRTIGPDHLFRYDRMKDVAAFLSLRLGKDIQFPKTNVSPDIGPQRLPPELRQRLKDYFAPEYSILDSLA